MRRSSQPVTRRALIKAGVALGALASTGSLGVHSPPALAHAENAPGKESRAMTANWYEEFIFKDESLVFELIRILGKATDHGSDIGEALATALRIKQKEGGRQTLLQAWYEEWKKLGERIEKIGEECLAKGHKVSARDAFLRAPL